MKKQIVLVCENKQQFSIVVEELSISKIIKRIVTDLSNPTKQFICLIDYVPTRDPNEEMWVRSSVVKAIVVANVSNIQVPNKKIVVPSGRAS